MSIQDNINNLNKLIIKKTVISSENKGTVLVEINQVYQLTCFLDILGFKEKTKDIFENNNQKSYLDKIICSIESIMLYHEHQLNNVIDENFKNIYPKIKIFNDTIILDVELPENENKRLYLYYIFFHIIAEIIKTFNLNGILLRGGISIGKHINDNLNFKNIEVIISESHINAYNLESKKSFYPRVLIDNNIVDDMIQINLKNSEADRSTFKNIYFYQSIVLEKIENNNIYFLNPFYNSLLNFKNEQKKSDVISISNKEYLSVSKLDNYTFLLGEVFKNIHKEIEETLKYTKETNIDLVEKAKIEAKVLWYRNFVNWIYNKEDNDKFSYFQLE